MSLHRRNPKRDANEPAIVDALEAIGVTVHRLSHPGLPDLLCWHRREGFRLVEVKTATGTLTEAQQRTVCSSLPFCIVRNEAEALALFGVRP
jgi:hypothetical protein